jgi:hypothetical protein
MDEIFIFVRRKVMDINKVKPLHKHVSMNLYVSEQGKDAIHKLNMVSKRMF